jgi:serine protease Do
LLAVLLAFVGAFVTGAAAQQRVVPQHREQVMLSFAPVVEKVAPAVVNIYARRMIRQRVPSLFSDPFFQRFFGELGPFGAPRERIAQSLGSGVIVDPSGLIVTNHHVIEGAEAIKVSLADRREFDAELVLSDEHTDLAVLRIDDGDEAMPYVELRDSEDVQVGDLVLAIGNPFGIGQTVTSGIVSALARGTRGISDFSFFIQTDAAINPGNSGGALVTLDGRLVGVNTAIFSKSGGSHGIGFAIPSALVRTVIAGATSGGGLQRPWFGATGVSVNADIAESLGMARPAGVLIEQLYPDGPASRAGLAVGDVVTAFNGHPVADANELKFRIATRPLGSAAPLEVLRDGRKRKLELSLEVPPEAPPRDETVLRGPHPLSGATVANLSPAFAIEIGADPLQQGVIIRDIAPTSPARRIGLQPEDVLLTLNDQDVAAVSQLRGLLQHRVSQWKIRIRRGERVLAVTVTG